MSIVSVNIITMMPENLDTNTFKLEQLKDRHKKEVKESQLRHLKLKKNVPKGDKKQKKQINEQIIQEEKELKERHEKEMLDFLRAVSRSLYDLKY
jgi:acetoin utilization deacetylase AcuC-like enzyme